MGAPNVRNAVKSVEVKDGGGNAKSRTEMVYDNASTTANLTQVKTWDSTKGIHTNPLSGNFVSVSTQYDQYGNPTLITDAKGNQTKLTYGTVGSFTDLYPTQTETAFGTSVERTTTMQYDFYTGLVTSVTDVDNNNLKNATEYDALGRPKKAISAVDTALEMWTRTEYDDIYRRVVVRSDWK